MNLKFLFAIILLISVVNVNSQQTGNMTYIDKCAGSLGSPKPLTDFEYLKPVFKLQGEQLTNKNRLLRFSALTGYREGVEPINGQFNSNFKSLIDPENGTHSICMYNLSIEEMLTHGLKKTSRVLLEVKDPSRYRYNPSYGSKQEWLRKNGYCYELLLPVGTINGINLVDDDLARLFHVKCKTEKRMVLSLVLVRTSNNEKFKASGGEKILDFKNNIYRNVDISAILGPWFNLDILPWLNETGYEGMIDVNLGMEVKSMDDLPAFRKALQRYDLDLKKEMRELEMFIISEK